MTAFNSLVEKMRIGKTGHAFIVNRAGDFQTKVPSEAKPSSEPYVSFLGSGNEALDAVNVVEREDSAGQECMNVMTSLKEGDWVLAHYQRCDEAYADLYSAYVRRLGIPHRSGSDRRVAIVLSSRIVKYIIKSDEENTLMNEQLVQAGKLAALGEMAAGIAHEIKQPSRHNDAGSRLDTGRSGGRRAGCGKERL